MEKNLIHHDEKRYQQAIVRVKNEESISEKQKKKFLRFIEEVRIGKAGKKRAGKLRLISYMYNFVKLCRMLKKDMDNLTAKEIEKFYIKLDSDKIVSRKGKPYKEATKNEMFKILKKYSDLIERPSITLEECKKILRGMTNPRDKAILMFLFDSGCRISEALNIKIKDIEKQKKKDDKGEFYLVDIKISKTLPRRISIPLASAYLTEWLKKHPERNNLEAYLFPIRDYKTILYLISSTSKKFLGKEITPHILRHSSATYYAKRIKPYPFCYRYGWTIGSSQARRYIDRTLLGEEEQEKLVNVIDDEKLQKLEEENKKVKKELSEMKKEQDKIIEKIKTIYVKIKK